MNTLVNQKSVFERALDKAIICGVLLVASGILVLIASALINPGYMIKVIGLSFPMIFVGIGLIAIVEKILTAID